MKFCSTCGSTLSLIIPQGDNRYRHVCDQCGEIHYQNPKIICGSLPLWENRILLCKRAIEPRYGYWTLPAGFMEMDETTTDAAKRETWEEAQTRVKLKQLYCVFNLPHVNQLYMMYLAEMESMEFQPGIESLAVGLYEEESIPWEELAFSTIRKTLEFYLQDRTRNRFPLHSGVIIKRDEVKYDYIDSQ